MSQYDRYVDPWYHPGWVYIGGAFESMPKKKIAYSFTSHPSHRKWSVNKVWRTNRYVSKPILASPPPLSHRQQLALDRQKRIARAMYLKSRFDTHGPYRYRSPVPAWKQELRRQQRLPQNDQRYNAIQRTHFQNVVQNRARSNVMSHKAPIKSAFSTDWPYQSAQPTLSKAVRDRIALNHAIAKQRLQSKKIMTHYERAEFARIRAIHARQAQTRTPPVTNVYRKKKCQGCGQFLSQCDC